MKTRNLIALILCILLLFNFVPDILINGTSIQPLDLYQEERMD